MILVESKAPSFDGGAFMFSCGAVVASSLPPQATSKLERESAISVLTVFMMSLHISLRKTLL
jgi:hypothetical protein